MVLEHSLWNVRISDNTNRKYYTCLETRQPYGIQTGTQSLAQRVGDNTENIMLHKITCLNWLSKFN
jgi:hypothetical protein